MRVLHISAINNTIYLFRKELLDTLSKKGFDISIAFKTVHDERTELLKREGYDIIELDINRERIDIFNIMSNVIKLRRILKNNRIDIVHTHTPIGGMIGRLAAYLASTKVVFHTTGGWYFHENMPKMKRYIFISLEKMLARVTTVIFSVNHEDIVTANKVSIRPIEDIVYSGPAGVQLDKFVKYDGLNIEKLRLELDIAQDQFVIGMIGRLVWEKGYKELIDTLVLLNNIEDARLNYCVIIIGKGPHENEIRKYAEDQGVMSTVKFLGYRDDVPALLRCMDIFLFPSHREGVPVGVQEAMVSQVPPIVFDIRGCRELVVNNESGIIVPFKDTVAMAQAVLDLAHNAQTRKRLGRNGRARIEKEYLSIFHVERQLEYYNKARSYIAE